MYLLNLLFAWPTTPGDGRFLSYEEDQMPLETSKTWMQLVNTRGGAAQDPTVTNASLPNPFAPWAPDNLTSGTQWQDVGQDGSLLLSKSSNPGYIAIRVAPTSAAPTNSTVTLNYFVVFGREPRALQLYASPFNIATGVNPVFTTGPFIPNNGGTQIAWFYALGPIVNAPTTGSLGYHFEFMVGANVSVTQGATTTVYAFSHDPEMDVSS
jgi:hypothetical protein